MSLKSSKGYLNNINRTPAEYFQGDSALVGCWPLRDSGMDVVSGNHLNLTNVVFSEGSAYFNGNAYAITRNKVNASASQKLTILFDVRMKVYEVTNAVFIYDAYNGLSGLFQYNINGAIVNDPIRPALWGAVGVSQIELYKNRNKLDDLNWHTTAMIGDKSKATRELSHIIDGVDPGVDNVLVNANNTDNFGNVYLSVGGISTERGIGPGYYGNFYGKNLCVLTRTDIDHADYYAWMNDVASKSRLVVLDTYSGKKDGAPIRGVSKEIR